MRLRDTARSMAHNKRTCESSNLAMRDEVLSRYRIIDRIRHNETCPMRKNICIALCLRHCKPIAGGHAGHSGCRRWSSGSWSQRNGGGDGGDSDVSDVT